MQLDNHIAKRLLTDEKMWGEMCAHYEKNDVVKGTDKEKLEQYGYLYMTFDNVDNETFILTKSVVDKLDLFDTKKSMSIDGWKLFNSLPNFKKTYILPDGNRCLRIFKLNGLIYFCHIEYTPDKIKKDFGDIYWVLLFVNLDDGEMAEHFKSKDGESLAPFLYALMCYTELCENETIILQPKAKYGTRKQGKIINTLPFPVTIINNTWNVTTILSDGFPVRGHSAIRWTGEGRTIPKLVYIEPFMKNGYTRRSGKEIYENK